MHPLQQGILETFRRDPEESFSTGELVRELFSKEYLAYTQRINSGDKKSRRTGFFDKASLHRKLLYHTNQLVEQGILTIKGIRGKGEKLYCLSLEEGELLVQQGKKRIIISKPSSIATPVDGYMEEGLIRKYQQATWLNKQNAILLDGYAFETSNALQSRIQQLLPNVNDALAVSGFEQLVNKEGEDKMHRLLEYLALDAKDYDVSIAVHTNLLNLEDEKSLIGTLKAMLAKMPRHVTFTFSVTPRLLVRKRDFFHELFSIFSEANQKLTLKNTSIFAPPIFFGRAGTYSFTESDWKYYKKHVRGKADGCVVGQASIVIDINKYFSKGGTPSGFRELTQRAAHAFFQVDEQRRKHFGEYFGHITMPSLDGTKEFFKVGRNYLRFWNYDWSDYKTYPILELLGSVREGLDEFSKNQETIFRSCGLPIRFKIAMSTSFAKFDQDFFTDRRYKKTAIGNVKDLQSKEMREYLQTREKLYRLFDGADRLRFFLTKGIAIEEAIRIARYLLSSYDLPSVTLDFRGKAGELKLTSFLEGD
jgi:hypothetical protein